MNGCNTSAFTALGAKSEDMKNLAHPIWLYVGRVSHEKNVLAFLELHNKLPGSLAIVVRWRVDIANRAVLDRFRSDFGWVHSLVFDLVPAKPPMCCIRCALWCLSRLLALTG